MSRAKGRNNTVTPRTDNHALDPRYPTGTPPSPPDITVSQAIPSQPTIQSGAATSFNLTSYVTGTGVSGSVWSINVISGATLASIGASFSGTTITFSSAIQGSGVYQLQVTKSGYTFLSNQFGYTVVPAAATDTASPTVPVGLVLTRVNDTNQAIVVDWPPDVVTATSTASNPVHALIERQTDGAGAWTQVKDLTTPGTQPSSLPTLTNIGGLTSPVFVYSGGDITLTVSDGVVNDTTDGMATGMFSLPFTTGFSIRGLIKAFTAGYEWAQCGMGVRQNANSLSPFVGIARRPDAGGHNSPFIARLVQGGTISWNSDAVHTGDEWEKIEYVASTQTMTRYTWNTGTGQWVTQGSFTIALTSPVLVGAFASNTTATPTGSTAFTLGQFGVNIYGQASANDTTTVNGHNYGYRSRAKDSASTPNYSAYGPVSTISTVGGGGGGGVDWFPGHYMLSNEVDRSANGQMPSILSELSVLGGSGGNVVGYAYNVEWNVLENTQDAYDFSHIDTVLANLPAGKKLIISLQCVLSPSNYTPAYIQADSTYGPAFDAGKYGYWQGAWGANFTDPNSIWYSPAYWRTAVLNRMIKLFQQLGAKYNSDIRIAAIQQRDESVWFANLNSGSGATINDAYSYWDTIGAAVTAAFPKKPFVQQINWVLADNTSEIKVMQTLYNRRNAFGGPDIYTGDPNYITACGIYRGAIGGFDYRGKMPFIHEVQNPELLNGQDPDATAKQAIQNYAANMILWNYLNYGATTAQWPNVLTAINNNPITQIAYPTGPGW